MLKDKKVMKLLFAVIILAFLIILGIFLYRNYLTSQNAADFWFDDDAVDGILAKDDPADIQKILNATVAKGMFDVVINAAPDFSQGGRKGKIGIQNIPGNHYPCMVKLTLDDENDTLLYQSAGIKPGQFIDDISLKKKLSKGNHPATATFTVVDDKKYQPIGEVRVKININVTS